MLKRMRMKMRKIEETDSIDLLYIEATNEKNGKKEIEKQLRSEIVENKAEKFLNEMLKFLAEMPIDKYHDYRIFRHNGLRGYLINRFLHERAYIINNCET